MEEIEQIVSKNPTTFILFYMKEDKRSMKQKEKLEQLESSLDDVSLVTVDMSFEAIEEADKKLHEINKKMNVKYVPYFIGYQHGIKYKLNKLKLSLEVMNNFL